jgi:predicted permease
MKLPLGGKRGKELDEEIESHVRMAIRDRMERGESAEEAEANARREFGNAGVVREVTQDAWGWRWLENLAQDVRFGLRMLGKSPGFTSVAVLTLALGIGANTTIFSWIHSVLLNPLPGVGEANRVVALETLTPDGNWVPTSYLDFRDLRDNCKLVESMSVAKPMDLAVGNDVNIERVWGEVVSGNFFELLHVQPELGRFFTTAEVDHEQNTHALAILSHSFWMSHYQADPRVIGATVRINHFPYTIIGVAPAAFHGSMPGLTFDMWAPATMYGQLSSTGDATLRDRKWRTFRVLARLAPGDSIEQARDEVKSIAKRMAVADADTNDGMSATLLPMWKAHYGIQESLVGPFSILMAACGVLLLIVCANVGNLLLTRATTRQKEFSLRLALGAPRSRLIRQVLTESLLIGTGGMLAGLEIASLLLGSLGFLLPRSSTPSLTRAPIDTSVLLFAIAVAFATAMIAGAAPAFQAAKGNVNDALKEGGRTGASARSRRLRGLFVVSEMALAMVALIGAGLFVKSFIRLSEIRPGFDPEHVAIANLDISAANYNAEQADSYSQRLREQLERQPGVADVSYADYVPLGVNNGSWEDLEIRGFVPAPGENMKIYRTLAAPGYFELMKIKVLQGRDFNLKDDMTALPVMIVNEEFVRRFIPNGTAIGRQVNGWGKWFTIVGVVQDSKVYRLTEAPTPYFYVPIRQIYRPEMGLVFYVRTSGPMDGAILGIRRAAQAVDPAVPVFEATSLDDIIAGSLFGQRISASLLSVLASVALLLAAIGLYGVMSYSVEQRTNEIGIRVALGAQPRDVLRLVLSDGARLAGFGVAGGALAGVVLTRLLSSLLFGISATDPFTFGEVAILLTGVALLACAIPALRAMRVDPMVALRYE